LVTLFPASLEMSQFLVFDFLDATKPYPVTLPENEDDHLGLFQTLVGGGYIESFPHKEEDADWIAYVNEEGRLRDFPPNPFAWKVLQELGFCGACPLGNVVLLGRDEKALTTEQLQTILLACEALAKSVPPK
jgi:hypothetical protein